MMLITPANLDIPPATTTRTMRFPRRDSKGTEYRSPWERALRLLGFRFRRNWCGRGGGFGSGAGLLALSHASLANLVTSVLNIAPLSIWAVL